MERTSELSLAVLRARGIQDKRLWISPTKEDIPSHQTIKGLEERAHWWINNVSGSRPILVYGDYDVDGISSCAIAAKFLRACGLRTEIFIPSRTKDGYGLSVPTLEKLDLNRLGGCLILDSGTTAHEARAMLEKSSAPTLILDHHMPDAGTTESSKVKIVNPRLDGGDFPCSAMLAYYFCQSVSQSLATPEMYGLAAMAGVADSIPMTAYNHTFIKLGLPELSHSPAIALMGQKLGFGLVTRELVSWQIAPRINAAGRMDNSQLAYDYLVSPSESGLEALEQLNQERRQIQESILEVAKEQGVKQQTAGQGVIVAFGAWHPGVLGVVASRLVDLFNLPTIVVGEGDVCQGSGRSPAGTDLLSLLRGTTINPTWYGGHSAALGVRIPRDQMSNFINEVSRIPPTRQMTDPVIEVISNTKQVNQNEAFAIECLEPFGPGFTQPIFGIQGKVIERNGNLRISDSVGECYAIGGNPGLEGLIPFHMIHTISGTTAKILLGSHANKA